MGLEPLRADGDRIDGGTEVLRIRAPLRELLGAERTLLNFLTHLSGIATATRAWADALSGTGCAVRDTRKTTPGLRQLEKYAVRCGGGVNHRMGLGDAALIKDNHVAAAGGIAAAIAAVRAAAPGLPLEVECDTLAQVREALDAGARLILLDNMDLADLRSAAAMARRYPLARLEASGGLRLEAARAVAQTGVDFVAVGALTHSSPALDLGLDLLGTPWTRSEPSGPRGRARCRVRRRTECRACGHSRRGVHGGLSYPQDVDWSLFGCARKGHVTYAPDEPELRARLMAPTAGGTAWRCLRCGAFVTDGQHGSGPAAAAPLIRRGKELRSELILRVFAVERFLRFLSWAAPPTAYGGSGTTGPASSGRSTMPCRPSAPCTGTSASTSPTPSCSG